VFLLYMHGHLGMNLRSMAGVFAVVLPQGEVTVEGPNLTFLPEPLRPSGFDDQEFYEIGEPSEEERKRGRVYYRISGEGQPTVEFELVYNLSAWFLAMGPDAAQIRVAFDARADAGWGVPRDPSGVPPRFDRESPL
jgi:hypothetical protein